MIPTMTCGQTSAPIVAYVLLSNPSSEIEFQVILGISEDLVFDVRGSSQTPWFQKNVFSFVRYVWVRKRASNTIYKHYVRAPHARSSKLSRFWNGLPRQSRQTMTSRHPF